MATERKMGSVIAGEKFDPSTLRTNQAETDYLYAALWHACAGPLVALPRVGDKVVDVGDKVLYYLQGHLEQVEASTSNGGVLEIPVYDITSMILCTVVHIQLKAEVDTDEVFAQVTLVPETEESEWLRVTLHKWLDDEYCPEATNIEISKVAAQSYYESLVGKQGDLGEILLKMATELQSISYQESFHGAFSSANAALHLIASRIEQQ